MRSVIRQLTSLCETCLLRWLLCVVLCLHGQLHASCDSIFSRLGAADTIFRLNFTKARLQALWEDFAVLHSTSLVQQGFDEIKAQLDQLPPNLVEQRAQWTKRLEQLSEHLSEESIAKSILDELTHELHATAMFLAAQRASP